MMTNCDLENENRQADAPQSGRSLLPICEADAPVFLSDVYNKRYTSEKTTSRCPQCGRSMIEMLGVLAIIGVLSVGGIAGYSKAMMKYRINKTIEQITLIAGNVRAFFAPQKNYNGLSTDDCCKDIVKKAKLVPDEMWNDYGDVESVWGVGVDIRAINKSTNDNKAFYIGLYTVPEEACIDLVSQDWNSLNIKGITLDNFDDIVIYLKTPVDVSNAIEACSRVSASYLNGKGNTDISFYFDIDVNSDIWKNKFNN